MAKKGMTNFTNQVAKEVIKEQKKKDKELQKQQKEEYINNKYEEAERQTDNINICISKLKNVINSNCEKITIEEFIQKDLQELILPKELLVPYRKPDELIIRKANIIEKIFKKSKEKYEANVNKAKDIYQKECYIYEKSESDRISQIELLTQIHQSKINEAINTKKELFNLTRRNSSSSPYEVEDVSLPLGYFDFHKKMLYN